MRFNSSFVTCTAALLVNGVGGLFYPSEFDEDWVDPLTEAKKSVSALTRKGIFYGEDDHFHSQLVHAIDAMSDESKIAWRNYLHTEDGLEFIEETALPYDEYPDTYELYLSQVKVLLPTILDRAVYVQSADPVVEGFSGRLIAMTKGECLNLLEEIDDFKLEIFLHLPNEHTISVPGTKRVASWASQHEGKYPHISTVIERILTIVNDATIDKADKDFICENQMLAYLPAAAVGAIWSALDLLRLTDAQLDKTEVNEAQMSDAYDMLQPCLEIRGGCNLAYEHSTFVRSALVAGAPSEADAVALSRVWSGELTDMEKLVDIYNTMTAFRQSRFARKDSELSMDEFVYEFVKIKQNCANGRCDTLNAILKPHDGAEANDEGAMVALKAAMEDEASAQALTQILNLGESVSVRRDSLVKLLGANPDLSLLGTVMAYLDLLSVADRVALIRRGIPTNAFTDAKRAAALVLEFGSDQIGGNGIAPWMLYHAYIDIWLHDDISDTFIEETVEPAVDRRLAEMFAAPACAGDDMSACADMFLSEMVINYATFVRMVRSAKGCSVLTRLIKDRDVGRRMDVATATCNSFGLMKEGWMIRMFYTQALTVFGAADVIDLILTDSATVRGGLVDILTDRVATPSQSDDEKYVPVLNAIKEYISVLPADWFEAGVMPQPGFVAVIAGTQSALDAASILVLDHIDSVNTAASSHSVRQAYMALLSRLREADPDATAGFMDMLAAPFATLEKACFDTEDANKLIDRNSQPCKSLHIDLLRNHVRISSFLLTHGCRKFVAVTVGLNSGRAAEAESKCDKALQGTDGKLDTLLDWFAAKSDQVGDKDIFSANLLFL